MDFSIHARIDEILEDIDIVKAKRDDYASGDGDNGRTDKKDERTLAPSLICRLFIILDWILDWEKRRTGLSEQDITILEELRTRVEGARVEANCTLEDVKAMRIPPPILKKIQPLNYLGLPLPLVREKILEFITCPIDKLSVMQVAPTDGEFMKWDEKELKFLAVFQILMNQGRLWKEDQFLLSIVTPGLRDLVKMNYESYLLAHQRHERRNLGLILRTMLPHFTLHFPLFPLINHQDLQRKEFRLNPIPGEIAPVITTLPYPDIIRFDNQLAQLQDFGRRIWDFRIVAGFDDIPLPEGIDMVNACLQLTPNLRKLVLGLLNFENGGENHTLDLDAVVFPKLRSLETLILQCKFERLERKLLEIYGRKLRHLHILDCTETEQEIDRSSLCPHLTSLSLKGGLDLIMNQLSTFQKLPLTVIELIVEYKSLITEYPALLCQISQQFGRTLESLSISSCQVDGQEGTALRHISSTWMTRLDFPKVKYLEIDYFGQQDGFKLLVLFPALETLYFQNELDQTKLFFIGRSLRMDGENQLISEKWAEMRGSILWKLLPRLDCYCLEKWERETIGGNLVKRNPKMFRKDCLTDSTF